MDYGLVWVWAEIPKFDAKSVRTAISHNNPIDTPTYDVICASLRQVACKDIIVLGIAPIFDATLKL